MKRRALLCVGNFLIFYPPGRLPHFTSLPPFSLFLINSHYTSRIHFFRCWLVGRAAALLLVTGFWWTNRKETRSFIYDRHSYIKWRWFCSLNRRRLLRADGGACCRCHADGYRKQGSLQECSNRKFLNNVLVYTGCSTRGHPLVSRHHHLHWISIRKLVRTRRSEGAIYMLTERSNIDFDASLYPLQSRHGETICTYAHRQ